MTFTNSYDALTHIAGEFGDGKAVVVNIDTPSAGSPLVGTHAYMVEQVN